MSQRVVDLERQCWANAQHSRTECLEVTGIPLSLDGNTLQKKVIQVFEKVGCNMDSSNTEACLRITETYYQITVKFSRRKDCERALLFQKNLKNIKWRILIWLGTAKFLLIIFSVRTTVYSGWNHRCFSICGKSIS